MNEIVIFVVCLAVGAGLGLVYFGGLWLTTRQIPHARGLVALILASYLGRLAICLTVFYLVATLARPTGLLVSIAGFALTQWMLMGRLGRRRTDSK